MIVRLADYSDVGRGSMRDAVWEAVQQFNGGGFRVEDVAGVVGCHVDIARKHVLALWRSGKLQREGRRDAVYRETAPAAGVPSSAQARDLADRWDERYTDAGEEGDRMAAALRQYANALDAGRLVVRP